MAKHPSDDYMIGSQAWITSYAKIFLEDLQVLLSPRPIMTLEIIDVDDDSNMVRSPVMKTNDNMCFNMKENLRILKTRTQIAHLTENIY